MISFVLTYSFTQLLSSGMLSNLHATSRSDSLFLRPTSHEAIFLCLPSLMCPHPKPSTCWLTLLRLVINEYTLISIKWKRVWFYNSWALMLTRTTWTIYTYRGYSLKFFNTWSDIEIYSIYLIDRYSCS